MDDSLENEYLEYTRFNALRTFSTSRDSQFSVRKLANAIAIVDDSRPCPGPCNRVLGFTAHQIDDLAELFSFYRDGKPQFDLENADEAVTSQLSAHGFRSSYSLSYMQTIPSDVQAVKMRVDRWRPDKANDFLELLKRSGVKCDEEVWSVRRQHYCTDTFRTFVAYVDQQPAGWATLYVSNNTGIFANAFTFEQFRDRGCHKALLAARLNDAVELGLEQVVTDVLPDSISHRNCLAKGFELIATHEIWQCDSA